ncbi:unnamed protein product [Penicillium salamii]|nr:unnamed protein product [Penicillium salamii]
MSPAARSYPDDSVADYARDDEPLLNHGEGATRKSDEGIYRNLFSGTACIAQAGIWILAVLVWNGVLSQPPSFFTPHPLLGVSALLLQVQATLIVQPVTTPQQKLQGTRIHHLVQLLSVIMFLSAFVIIEMNKIEAGYPHFTSLHGKLGLATCITIALQAMMGVVQYFVPVTVLGSVDAGKRIYKYHRWSGHALLLLEMATVMAAIENTYAFMGMYIPLSGVLVAILLTLMGVGLRIQKQKLGL